jgi:hypothetical protein
MFVLAFPLFTSVHHLHFHVGFLPPFFPLISFAVPHFVGSLHVLFSFQPLTFSFVSLILWAG